MNAHLPGTSWRRRRAGIALACVVLAAACSKRRPDEAATGPAEAPAVTAEAPAGEPVRDGAAAPVAPVGEEEALGWLSAWLEAQNTGSFEGYAAL